MAFANVRLPTSLSYGAQGGPGTSTTIIETEGGGEVRISRWPRSRRRWNVGYAIQTYADLALIREFFEARRGPAEAFRFKDPFDYSTAQDGQSTPTMSDWTIGTGDGSTTTFQLVKRYQSSSSVIDRPITKPVSGTVVIAINGVLQDEDDYSVDEVTGIVTFDTAPTALQTVTAGCEFDVPVRFGDLSEETLYASYDDFSSGSIPDVPIIEVVEEVNVPTDFISGGALDIAIQSDYTMSPSIATVYTLSASSGGLKAKCPDPTSLPLGKYFTVLNLGSNNLIVADDSGSTLVTLAQDEAVDVCLGEDASNTKFWYTY